MDSVSLDQIKEHKNYVSVMCSSKSTDCVKAISKSNIVYIPAIFCSTHGVVKIPFNKLDKYNTILLEVISEDLLKRDLCREFISP